MLKWDNYLVIPLFFRIFASENNKNYENKGKFFIFRSRI